MKIQKFKYDESGLDRFFGRLEAKIMDILWSHSAEMTIKEVQVKLEREKKVNFNTVMTVMNRLVDKEILLKRSEGRKTHYQPTESKENFLERQSKVITHEIMEEFGPITVSHMLDELEDVDQSLLEKLERKVQELKKQK